MSSATLRPLSHFPGLIQSSNSRSPLPVRIAGIQWPDTSLSRSDGCEHLTTAQFTISSAKTGFAPKWRRGVVMASRAFARSILCFSPMPTPRAHSGKKRSDERTWAYYPKAVKTNEIVRSVINRCTSLTIAMSDVQNSFLEALAVIFVKVQYLYFRRKLSVSSIRWYQFPVAHSMYAEVTLILIFSHTNFH